MDDSESFADFFFRASSARFCFGALICTIKRFIMRLAVAQHAPWVRVMARLHARDGYMHHSVHLHVVV